MKNKQHLVISSLHFKMVDIELALVSHASQENCDNEEHTLMMEAAKCIKELREEKEDTFSALYGLFMYGEWSAPYRKAYERAKELVYEQETED